MRKLLSLVALVLCLSLITGCGLDTLATDPSVLLPNSGTTTVTDATGYSSGTTPVPSTGTAGTTLPSTSGGDPETSVPTQTSAPDTPATQLPESSSFSVHFIDVGQADAALIECDGHYMLIDGGNVADSSLIYSYLKRQNVSELEYVVATHAHEDHVGGLSGALALVKAKTALSPVTDYDTKAFRNFISALADQGVSLTIPRHGDTFSLGSANCQILGPIYSSEEPNNTSLVIRIQYGQTSFLFTGDAELEEENSILDAGYDIQCAVLKVSHHGSSTSTGYRWLRAAAPAYAVISVGTGNDYGHPHEGPLSRLRDAEVTTYRTDLQGHIVAVSDGTDVTFTVQKNANADTLAGAGEGGNHGTDPTQATTSATEASNETGTSGQALYVLNTNSKKFHYPDCASAKKISDKNRQEITTSREELISQGYSPCGNCDP